MVIANIAVVKAAQVKRGWDDCRLASEMGVSYQTVVNLFAGNSLGDRTQTALFDAFDGEVALDQLFEIVVKTNGPEPASVSPAGSGS